MSCKLNKNLTGSCLGFEELPSSQPGVLSDNSEDDIFSVEWCDNPVDDPDYTPDDKESPFSSETGSAWSSQKISVRNMLLSNSSISPRVQSK